MSKSHYKTVPMGFETNGCSRFRQDLSCIIRQSLWDLKLADEPEKKEVQQDYKTVPMGFETKLKGSHEFLLQLL